jgi:hypothetical protein
MAKQARPAARKPPQRKKKGGSIVGLLGWLAAPVLLFIAAPVTSLVIVGMLPTIVAGITDRRAEKYSAYCVGGFNLSAVFPYALYLLLHDNTIRPGLTRMLGDPIAWLAWYGAAAVGWGVYSWIPQMTVYFSEMRERSRLSALKKRQQALVDEWGAEIFAGKEAPADIVMEKS